MKKKKCWNDMKQVFEALNDSCNYVILRNYEELDTENIVMEEHDDIDILCDDQKAACRLLGAVYKPVKGNYDHFFIDVGDREFKFGIRYIGDNYYDVNWEKHMISNKVMHPSGFYVMDDEDYFYSLLYHALLQKKKFSEDYKERLKNMGSSLKIELESKEDFLHCIHNYMKDNGYEYTYPKDPTIPVRFGRIKEFADINPIGYNVRQLQNIKRIPIRAINFFNKKVRRK